MKISDLENYLKFHKIHFKLNSSCSNFMTLKWYIFANVVKVFDNKNSK